MGKNGIKCPVMITESVIPAIGDTPESSFLSLYIGQEQIDKEKPFVGKNGLKIVFIGEVDYIFGLNFAVVSRF